MWKSPHKSNTLSPSWEDEEIKLDLATIEIREAAMSMSEYTDEDDGEDGQGGRISTPPPLSYYRQMLPLLRVEVHDYNRLTTGKFLGGVIVPPNVYMKGVRKGMWGEAVLSKDANLDSFDDDDIISLGSLRERGPSRDDDEYSTTAEMDSKPVKTSPEAKNDVKDGPAIGDAKSNYHDEFKGNDFDDLQRPHAEEV